MCHAKPRRTGRARQRVDLLSGGDGIIKILIKHGADIHAYSEQALRKATATGHLPIVKYLVSQGACIHAEDDEALKSSAYNNHLRVVAYLIEQGA
ncbi:ankyrin repeat domain-containing protein [Alcaligenes faecalis]|nr:ankyrin repeat domain-containing protein [Alcaligenes faecalis]